MQRKKKASPGPLIGFVSRKHADICELVAVIYALAGRVLCP